MLAGIFEVTALPLTWFYALTHNYAMAIGLVAVAMMIVVTPLLLKSTKGMLEMQRLGPEMRQLQAEYRSDRQKLNEEMMKLYQEHNVNPMASCLPLLAQTPIFFIMFRVLEGLSYTPRGGNALVAQAVLNAGGDTRPVGFVPQHLAASSEMYQALVRKETMSSLGLDLSRSAREMLGENLSRGLLYAGLVALLGLLYFGQQRMVAARAAVSPTMSPTQQKMMQYLPVLFAVFQIFFVLGLVVYYIVQSVLRILQQFYITKRFYGHEESLGRQAQAANVRAREIAQADGGGGPLAQARRDLAEARKAKADSRASRDEPEPDVRTSKRTTPPKNRPTATSKRTTAPKNRPTPSAKRSSAKRPASRPKNRPSSSKKRRR